MEGEADELQPGETGFFYLVNRDGTQPRRPAIVRRDFPRVGVIPLLSPLEHDERPLKREYVTENSDGRLTSRHFRNQLALLMTETDSLSGQSIYDTFKTFVGEWAPEIDLRPIEVGEQIDVYYREAGRRAEKEVFWAGDGFQVWLQVLLHLFRLQEMPAIVLDEPDAFLHPDLQRRLVRLLETFGSQTITATHSAEVLAEAPRQSVIWVDKTRRRAVRAPSEAVLSELSDSLGSQFNLRLAKALRVRAVMFVEGDDMKLLPIVAKTIGATKVAAELGIAIIPLHGFSNWEHVEPFAWLTKDFLTSSVQTFVVLDSDYRPKKAVERVKRRLRSVGVTPRVWKRKELESYFLELAAIARRSGTSPSQVKTILGKAADGMRDAVHARMLDAYLESAKSEGKHRVTLTQEFNSLFNADWKNERWRLDHCPPKELLKAVNRSLEAEGHRTVTLRSIASSLRAAEVPEEMANLLLQVEEQL